MGKKYLDTKESSLESSILGVWETAIGEREEGFDGRTSNYKSHRAKLEASRVRRENKKLNKEEVGLGEATGDKEAYQKFFQKTLKKFGVKSPAELKGDKKKKFFDAIDAGWEGDNEKKEEVDLDEKAAKYLEIEFKDKTTAEKAYNHINNKIEPGGRQPWDDFNQEGSSIQFDNMRDADGLMKELKKKFKFKVYEREEVELDEGKMSQLHQMIKDKKTAAQIAKEMKLDVKTVKALMASYEQMVPESFEIGTEKYLKHTVETTPGQKAWTEVVTKKAASMRETLAKMWKVDEGKNVFAKEAKKDLTNAVKGGKTMTGKKISVVDTSPTIKEKKK